ncbi:hypothetical protein [Maricaulis sp.]|uniref:hypothetical protein n=1 Tax=Maricaulis sp. TaxID=1486257 RepID=UPI001B123557|nr:hypothetical protein [Maricaulis sp.]MBO6764115.1 hypothetical protein [Maricaulis sp.]
MPDSLRKLIDTLREQATPRALAGVGILVVLLAAVGLSNLATSVAARQQDVRELDRSLAIQRSLANGQQWLDAAGELAAQKERVEASFWRGATTGIVSARLQSAIESAATQAGLDRVRVEVQARPDALAADGRLEFEITLTARDRDGQFLNFFQRLQTLDGAVVPSDFQWVRGNTIVQATLRAPAIVETATGEAS